ncbi:MAG: AbrB family transcriptional regulator [Peptococcaceae bacterium]
MVMGQWFIVVFVAIFTGLLFYYFNIPAGAMLGSLLATTVIVQFKYKNKTDIPINVKRSVRVLMGTFVGLGMIREGLYQMRTLFWPFAITIFLNKFFKWKLTEALLSSIPAGLSEVGMNAEELETDLVIVTTMHLVRLIGMIIIIPFIVKLFLPRVN